MKIVFLMWLMQSLSCGLFSNKNPPKPKEAPEEINRPSPTTNDNLPSQRVKNNAPPRQGREESPVEVRGPATRPDKSKGPTQEETRPISLPEGQPGKFPDLLSVCSEISSAHAALPKFTPLTDSSALKASFIDAHNKVRRAYGLNDLKWNDEIARYAQEWADYLRDNNNCKIEATINGVLEGAHRSLLGRRDGKQYGENLAWFAYRPVAANTVLGSAEKSVLGWSEECKDYNYETNECTPGKMCGHFTQAVWKSSEEVGCARTICINGQLQEEIYVCNYNPAGNMIFNGVKLKPF